MRRLAFPLIILVGSTATPARADTLPLIEGVPGTYTPGQAFTFQVEVPHLSNFSQYVVALVFGTTIPNPPLFVYSTAAPPAPLGRYVFSSNAGYQSTATLVMDSPDITLTFADSTATPVVTQLGLNDTLATVTVIPEAGLTGPITISIGNATQLTGEQTGDGGVSTPGPFVVQPVGNSVPSPPGVVLVGIGGVFLGVRSRFRKSAVTGASQ